MTSDEEVLELFLARLEILMKGYGVELKYEGYSGYPEVFWVKGKAEVPV